MSSLPDLPTELPPSPLLLPEPPAKPALKQRPTISDIPSFPAESSKTAARRTALKPVGPNMKGAKRGRSVNGRSKGKGRSPNLYLEDDLESLSELEELMDARDAADDEYKAQGGKKKYKKVKGLDGKPIRSRFRFTAQSFSH